jgi:ATP-dependent protease HslVU (ClpYQ) peptidase subunit
MSVAIAIVDNRGVVHMIADSQATTQADDRVRMKYPKIRSYRDTTTNENILLGVCGPTVYCQFLLYQMILPPLPPKDDFALQTWCVTTVRNKFRKDFEESDLPKKEKDGVKMYGGGFLVGMRGTIIYFEGSLAARITTNFYDAIGSGEEYAMGAMHHALRDNPKPPPPAKCKNYLLEAMRAAAYFKVNIGPPYKYHSTNGETETFDK